MTTAAIIISVLILLAAIVSQVLPRHEQYFKHRPRLIVELEPGKGITKKCMNEGLTTRNESTIIAGGPETWYLYRIEWEFNLVVRNNSEHNAYEVRLLQHTSKPQIRFRNNINFNKAIKSQEEITLPFTIHNLVECQAKDREKHYTDRPKLFDDLMIVFDYKNPKGRSFQSRYYFNHDKTTFDRISSNELKEYWR